MIKIFILILLLFLSTNAWALRIPEPPTLSYPLTEEQVSQMNKYLRDIWNIMNGRFELDVVTTPKTNAKDGEIWLIYTAPNTKIQFKAEGTIYTTP